MWADHGGVRVLTIESHIAPAAMDEGYYLKERNKTLTKFLPVYKESERGLYPIQVSGLCSLE